ncbi:hypothetical protein N7476_006727 [Penicillium atrosanguineum]|uniref:PNPLA domain-containing protein n=1 Tax=Penicillium atrosanguineum TaxID=1132637 RepID=A0A9W9PYA9_9EURO|nr:hypothetical protein N7476_006727 [Penicillium atrosanguineum]
MPSAMTTNDIGGASPLNTNGLCLLSLDGGGVRGLSSLYILRDIMAQLNYERVDEEPLKPCDVFDLIGGTSTGGLIAIMLGRLEMGIDECIAAYSELMHLIFGQKMNNLPVDWAGNIRAQYDSTKLKHAIEHVIEGAGVAPDAPMNNGQTRRCRAFIARLRSYDVTNEDTIPATICEAALATSAATGFFETVSIGEYKFVDGAFGANNPMEEVEEEAADIWCTTSRELRPLVKCFLSIGTGAPAKAPIDDNMLKFLSKTLVRMATKPESTERRFMARWSKELREKHVFRFNVEQGLQDVHMTDYQKRSAIESATYDYLHHSSQKGRVRDCIVNLLGKEGKTDIDFDIVMRAYETQELRSQVIKTIHSSSASSVPGKEPCWIVPFERNHRFVDRELLGKIKRKLFLGRQMQRISIVGLGGVGKTQIALELAFQVKEIFPDCSIFWIPVVDMESVQQAYQNIASQLGIEIPDEDEKDVKKAVQRHLSRPQSGRWLLIYDNADDLSMWSEVSPGLGSEGLREYLPKASSSQGAILFTTRSHKVAQFLASTEIIEIAEMDEHKATKVLKNLLVNKSLVDDHESTKKLLDRLTFLPLAIVQAASFMNENLMDISSYVELLDGQAQDTIDLLSQKFEDEGRYKSIRNPVATTWLTSFDQIRRQNTLAFDYMAFMACINPKDIPVSLLPPASPVEREKALGLLCSYSFIHSPHSGSRLDMHRLVQLATANWLKSINTLHSWHFYALRHISRHYQPNCDLKERSEWRAAMPHALQILHLTSSEPATLDTVDLLSNIGYCQRIDGRYKEAIENLTLALENSVTMLGHNDERSLIARGYLASSYQGLGEFEKAMSMFEEILDQRKSAHGLECVKTNQANLDLAIVYRMRGCPENRKNDVQKSVQYLQRAKELASQGLRYYMRNFGPENDDTLFAISILTQVYLAQGRLSNAGELAQQSLAIHQNVLGPDHLGTTAAMTTLADIYMQRWKLRDAQLLYAEALTRAKKFLGPGHPTILRDMHQMAWTLKLQNRHSEALALMTECVSLGEKSLGAKNYTNEETRQCISDWTVALATLKGSRSSRSYFQISRLTLSHYRNPGTRLKFYFVQLERSNMMLKRRKYYPKVKILGGLSSVRREPKDDPIIREIKDAVNCMTIPRHFSSGEVTLMEGCSVRKP